MRIRHSNFIERTFGETRRRVKAIGRLPGEHSCTSLIWAVLERLSRLARVRHHPRRAAFTGRPAPYPARPTPSQLRQPNSPPNPETGVTPTESVAIA